MAFDFAKLKTLARRTVHQTLGVRAFYSDDVTSIPVEVKARWHNKIGSNGDLDNQGYAVLIEGIDRIIFSADDARTNEFKRGGEVCFPDYATTTGGDPLVFILNTREPSNGPYEEVWEVTRKETP